MCAGPRRPGPHVSVETTYSNSDILWPLCNNLPSCHRAQSLSAGDDCTLWNRLKPSCACASHRYYSVWGLTLIQRISQGWIRDHLLCGAQSGWTTVSYVNGPFVQSSDANIAFMRCIIQVLTGAAVHKWLLYICKQLAECNLPVFPHYRWIIGSNAALKIDFRQDKDRDNSLRAPVRGNTEIKVVLYEENWITQKGNICFLISPFFSSSYPFLNMAAVNKGQTWPSKSRWSAL